MAILDLAIYVIIAATGFIGWRRGFISQASSLAAIILGVILCRLLGPAVVDMVVGTDAIGIKRFATQVFVYLALYAVVGVLCRFLGSVLHKLSHVLLLGPIDHLAGAALCIAKWMIGISLVLNLYLAFSPQSASSDEADIAANLPLSAVVKVAPALFGFTESKILNNESDNQTSGRSKAAVQRRAASQRHERSI